MNPKTEKYCSKLSAKPRRFSGAILRGSRFAFRDRAGFSLIEIVVVVSIIAVISVVSLVQLFGSRKRAELDGATRQIVALLRDAQSRSMHQEQGVAWGVHLENSTSGPSFYALFKTSYGSSTAVDKYTLPNSVRFASTSIAQGSSLDITFSSISGNPSTSTTINFELTGANVPTPENVSRSASGKIFFDDFGRGNL